MAAIISNSIPLAVSFPFAVAAVNMGPATPSAREIKSPERTDSIFQKIVSYEKGLVANKSLWSLPNLPIEESQVKQMIEFAVKLAPSIRTGFHNIKKTEAPHLPKMHLFKHAENGDLRLFFKVPSISIPGGSKIVQRCYGIQIPFRSDKIKLLPAARLKVNMKEDLFNREVARWQELNEIGGTCKLFNYATYEGYLNKAEKIVGKKHIIYADLFDSTLWLKTVSPDNRKEVFLSLIQTLIDFHNKKLFHGDITTGNILSRIEPKSKATEIVFTDFGSSFNQGITSPMFRAPEAYFNPHADPYLMDIWSLGCCCYSMKMGDAPAWSYLALAYYNLSGIADKWQKVKPNESETSTSLTDIPEIALLEKLITMLPSNAHSILRSPKDINELTFILVLSSIQTKITLLNNMYSQIKVNDTLLSRLFSLRVSLFEHLNKAWENLSQFQPLPNVEDMVILGMLNPNPSKRMSLKEAEGILMEAIPEGRGRLRFKPNLPPKS